MSHDFVEGSIVSVHTHTGRFRPGLTAIVKQDFGCRETYVGLEDKNDNRGYWNVYVRDLKHVSECNQCKFDCKLPEKCWMFEAKKILLTEKITDGIKRFIRR